MNFFDKSEIGIILYNIKKRLAERHGILSGVTVLNADWEYYKVIFTSSEDIEKILLPYFNHVTIWTKESQVYFFASDGTLPFIFSDHR